MQFVFVFIDSASCLVFVERENPHLNMNEYEPVSIKLYRRHMAGILPIRRKNQNNQPIKNVRSRDLQREQNKSSEL